MNKKLMSIGLSIMILASSITPCSAISRNTCIKNLKLGKSYKYDIDGDKDKDNIKAYISNNKLILNVNGCKKTLVPKC